MPIARGPFLCAVCLFLAFAIVPAAARGPFGDRKYTPEEIESLPAETLLERLLDPGPEYQEFAGMWALIEKAKQSDPEARGQILAMVSEVMQDQSRDWYPRYQCCYVLSGSGDERAVPALIQVLRQDRSSRMRAVAAEALADFPKNAAAHEALLEAARRETDQEVRETLTRRLGKEMPAGLPVVAVTPPPPAAASPPPAAAAPAVEEWAPEGAPQPPPGPKPPVAEPLPWPFPGGQQDQSIFNNYQQATDGSIHCGLDFIHPVGTPVTAVDSGYVAAIATNYPQWKTHYFFIITPEEGGNEGWCYTHLDPDTFAFREGDFIERGQLLGSLVDFSLGDQPGVAHLHLHYVRFSKQVGGKVSFHSLIDPLYYFDWKDTAPPTFQPLRFVAAGTTREFPRDADGVITVSGRVDVIAAIADGAYRDHMGNLGVPVVMVSISDGTHTVQALVVDHRGDVGNEKQVRPIYLSYAERKAFLNPDSFPRYQMLRVTSTDGDGKITRGDVGKCWDTTARNSDGGPFWPDGEYAVNVYAWDISGNRGVVGAIVRVENH